ncbi:MAG: hypothetical protein SCARUB_00894 [Candidatus Scalindua rubra]|uniref:VWFA domain-containing protein n=1 Tax=Candidatus Scalindua rubra TaxID=1872076 RepID=A0A1E3XE50_9BACT|nr:MAG: hypothetical protein SCARUB_00894 [Candidatus Scalindua rubra]
MNLIIKIFMILIVLTSVSLISSCSKEKEDADSAKKEEEGIHKEFERGPVKVILDVDKKELSIAERLKLTISIIAEQDYKVKLPGFGEKLEQFGIIDYQTSPPKLLDKNKTEISRSYILEPFLSGKYKIPPMKFKFFKKDESEQEEHTLETEEIEIVVKSLLPEKMQDLKIHDILPPVKIPFQYTKKVWISIVVIIVIISSISGMIIWRKYYRKIKEEEQRIPAHIIAYREMENLVAEDLIEKGEIKKFYQEISNILRRYIENRFGLHAPEQTTEEFLMELNYKDDLNGRPDDLIGMIVFARYANTVCPLTLAHGALPQFLKTVKLVQNRAEDGTAIGDALALGAARLKKADETIAKQRESNKKSYEIKSKVIILLSDGENNCGKRDPLTAAGLAKKWGIKIYTIAIGGGEGVATIQTPFGAYKVPMGAGVDTETLKQIAEITGGFFRKAEDAESLYSIYKEIDQMEKSEVESVRFVDYKESFSKYALAALFILIVEVILNCTFFRKIP